MVAVGKILKTWGNRGELVFDPAVDPCPELEPGAPVCLVSRRHRRTFTLAGQRLVNGLWLIKLAGVDTINQAFPLIGCELQAAVSAAAEPATPSLVGYEVVEKSGESWGCVGAVRQHPAPLLEVEAPGGGGPRLVPLHDAIVVGVDHERRRLTIDPPNGLKELNG